jgi:hypothetical protein
MTDSTDTQSLVPASLAPRQGQTVALIEIWKRPDIGFPSTFCRAVRPKSRTWVPELGDTLIHKSGARCVISGIREVTDATPVFIVTWDDDHGEVTKGTTAEFEADEFRDRFIPKALPALEFETSEWEPIDRAFAKRALRLGRYTLVEFPGVEWAARRFESDRATQRDYDRVIQLRDEHRAAKRANHPVKTT